MFNTVHPNHAEPSTSADDLSNRQGRDIYAGLQNADAESGEAEDISNPQDEEQNDGNVSNAEKNDDEDGEDEGEVDEMDYDEGDGHEDDYSEQHAGKMAINLQKLFIYDFSLVSLEQLNLKISKCQQTCEVIAENQKEILKYLRQQGNSINLNNDFDQFCENQLPLASKKQFIEFDKKLRDEEFKQYMVKQVPCWVPRSFYGFVFNSRSKI
jgi:hypothetical protein